jgi:hypothetical protein
MRYFRNVLPPLVGVALVAVLAGCGSRRDPRMVARGKALNEPVKTDSGSPEVPPSGKAPREVRGAPSAPKRSLKAAKDLKVPEGIGDGKVTESKMPRSWWVSYENARVGDLAEYEFPGTGMRSRAEVIDLGDHAVMTLMETTMEVEGKQTKTRSAMRLLFTEDEPSAEAKEKGDVVTYAQRPANRVFKVDDREIRADRISETFQAGKVLGRAWQSKELPSAVLQTEDGDGKVSMRLVRYRRGR